MRLTDKFDPALLLRSNPSFTETKEYSIETEVSVHRARAAEIKRIMRRRFLQIAAVVSCAVVGVVITGANVQGGNLLGVGLGGLLLAAAAGVYAWLIADWEVDGLLIETFRHDIVDPQRDSERRAEIDAILAYLQSQQQPARAPAVVRVESTVREPGSTTPRTLLDDLPGHAAQWQWFAKNVLGGDTFSERTARATGVGLTREEWTAARDIFLERGWAVWNHPGAPQQGVTLLAAGRKVLEKITDLPVPHRMVPMEE